MRARTLRLGHVFAFLLLGCIASRPLRAQTRRTVDRYDDDFRKYSKRWFGAAFDWRWFKAQGMAESNLDSAARSYVGARGLMQLMPVTFREIASKNPELERIDDPVMNIAAGIAYDRRLWLQWESDSIDADRARFMFASYNAGRGTLRNAQKMAREQRLDPRLWPNIETIAPKVPRWRHAETLGYVRKITAYINHLDERGRSVTDDVTVRGLKR